MKLKKIISPQKAKKAISTGVNKTLETTVKLKRCINNLTTTPFQSKWLNPPTLARLTSAISDAKKGHFGEIKLLIERSLPMSVAWNTSIEKRAKDWFEHLRIWDTKYRSGVLIYLNLAEHRLEIIPDERFLVDICENKLELLEQLADEAIYALYNHKRVEALEELIKKIGDLMKNAWGEYGEIEEEVSAEVLLR